MTGETAFHFQMYPSPTFMQTRCGGCHGSVAKCWQSIKLNLLPPPHQSTPNHGDNRYRQRNKIRYSPQACGWGTKGDYDVVFVDAVVDCHDGTMIYSGYLSDFVCNGEELDRIYLAETIRRDWKKRETDEMGTAQFINYPGEPIIIPGELFAIPYKDIKNLNVRFISVDNSLEDIQELPDDMSKVQDTDQ